MLRLSAIIVLMISGTSVLAQPRTAHVEMLNGRPTLHVNDEPMTPMFYALTDVPGGRWSWEELPQHNLRRFCDQGIRLFQVDLFFEHVWKEDGSLDLDIARRQLDGVARACPEGNVVFRFHVTAPRWWRDRHPEEWVEYLDTDYFDEDVHGSSLRPMAYDVLAVRRVSLASTLYREEATAKLGEFLPLLAALPEADNLIGLHIADGVYGEWHYWGFYYHEPDKSVPMTVWYRDWLREKYGSEENLRRAWNRPGASFETATVPDLEERRTTDGIFRDPAREQPVIDYYRAQHAVVTDHLLHYARLVRETWPRPLVIGTFFGYYFSTFGRHAAGGHLEVQRVFQSPYIDYVSAPNAYEPQATRLGDPYRSRGLVASARLNGKLWLDEMDNEPTTPIIRDPRHDRLLKNSIANVRRNTLFSAVQGMGLWYYDFGVAGVDLDNFRFNQYGSRGTWDHDGIMNEIGAMKRIVDRARQDEYATGADVLFVFDTESYYYTGSLHDSDPVSQTLEDYGTLAAWRSGVSLDAIHMADLPQIDLEPYRVVVLGNIFVLDDVQRAFIRDHVARDGRTLVFNYAPGYLDGASADPQAVSEFSGFRLARVRLTAAPEISLALPDSTWNYTVGESAFEPLFAVDDGDAEILGTYVETGQGAVARKEFEDHSAWFVALPSKDTEPFRHILHSGEAHVYSPQGDVVYAGDGLIVVHGGEGGRRTVVLKDGTERVFELPEGTAFTLVLDARTGEQLLPSSR